MVWHSERRATLALRDGGRTLCDAHPYVPTVTSLRHIVGRAVQSSFPQVRSKSGITPLSNRTIYSACSGMIYGDRMLFDDRSMHAFTCEPFHNLINTMFWRILESASALIDGKEKGKRTSLPAKIAGAVRHGENGT